MTMPGQYDERDEEFHQRKLLRKRCDDAEARVRDLEALLKQRSVIQDWALKLPLKMQSVLCLSLRGCDGKNKEDPSKTLLRQLRQVVFINANPNWKTDPNDKFMRPTADVWHARKCFIDDLDHYPMHWLMHFLHGCEIVGYKHPDSDIRDWWDSLYCTTVREGLHLNPESKEQLDRRLG